MDGRQGAAGSRGSGDGVGVGLLLLACLFWGTSPVGMRLLVGATEQGLPVLPVLALRYGSAAILFLPFLLRRRVPWSGVDWRRAALAGLCGITGYNVLASFARLIFLRNTIYPEASAPACINARTRNVG